VCTNRNNCVGGQDFTSHIYAVFLAIVKSFGVERGKPRWFRHTSHAPEVRGVLPFVEDDGTSTAVHVRMLAGLALAVYVLVTTIGVVISALVMMVVYSSVW